MLSPSSLSLLGSYDWPGNVAVQNVLTSAMIAARNRRDRTAGAAESYRAIERRQQPRVLADAPRVEERYVRGPGPSGGRATWPLASSASRQGHRKLTSRLGLARGPRIRMSAVRRCAAAAAGRAWLAGALAFR